MTDERERGVCAVCALPIVRITERLWRHETTLRKPWLYHQCRPKTEDGPNHNGAAAEQ